MSKVISISKIKKINLIKKNWILNGIRDLDIGSNPHSKGDIFSRFLKNFIEIKKFKINIINLIINKINVIKIKNKIIYIKIFKFFNWKLNVIFILYKYK